MGEMKSAWKTLFVICLCLISCFCTYRIVAYFVDTDSAVNEFANGGNETEIVENFDKVDVVEKGKTYTKDVKIKNTGESDCYARVKVEFGTKDVGDYCYLQINTKDWVYNHVDEYYYYKPLLEENEITSSLFTEVTIDDGIPDEKLESFHIYVYEESCQSCGYETYQSAWANYLKNKS